MEIWKKILSIQLEQNSYYPIEQLNRDLHIWSKDWTQVVAQANGITSATVKMSYEDNQNYILIDVKRDWRYTSSFMACLCFTTNKNGELALIIKTIIGFDTIGYLKSLSEDTTPFNIWEINEISKAHLFTKEDILQALNTALEKYLNSNKL